MSEMMDENDVYTHSRLLYKHEFDIAYIYTQLIKIVNGDQTVDEQQLIKKIDHVNFQNFKNRTALISVQKDRKINQDAHASLLKSIEKVKEEIKQLGEQAKMAETIKKRKIEFNQLVNSIKSFKTNKELNQQLEQIQKNINEMEAAYEKQMQNFAVRERTLRIAMSALNVFLKENPNSN